MQKIIIGMVIPVVVVIVAITGYKIYQPDLIKNSFQKACTEEAKICPDGSAVGRVGLNCEFAPCPMLDVNDETKTKLSETEARVIAENVCIKGGETIEPGYYNENSKTWWFDANLNETKEGCNPACVVSEETKTAEVNWRCTGLINSKEPTNQIRELFAKKYPKYAKTIDVSIDREIGNYMRGGVSFETGAPGGIFLAKKIDGQWQLVFDGNGQIPCDLSSYGFPNEMLIDCTK